MNQLSLGIVVLVAFTYFGGSYVPNVLKSNKQMLLGVVGGLVLGSIFFSSGMGGNLVEGVYSNCDGENLDPGYFVENLGENHITCSRESARARGEDNCFVENECNADNHMDTLHLTLDEKHYRLTCRKKRGIFNWVQDLAGDPGEIDGEKAIPWTDETSGSLEYPAPAARQRLTAPSPPPE